MFRTIILSIAAVITMSSVANAYEVDYNKAYKVVHNNTGETLSDISFEPQIEWVNGFPYVSVKEFDREGRQHMNLYSYHEIFLYPIDPKNIIN
jgi:hypothetical protein